VPVKLTEAEYQRLLQGRAPRPAPLVHTEGVDDWVECPDCGTRYRESQYGHQCNRMGKQPGRRRRRRRSTVLAVRIQAASRYLEAGLPPDDVARCVQRVLDARRPRLRYRVGADVTSSFWFRRVLPAGLFHRLVHHYYRLHQPRLP